jgi:LmbE family N-acetylglucosaminyl deacetylase
MKTLPTTPGRFRPASLLLVPVVAVLLVSALWGDPRIQPTPLTGSPELRETLDRLNTLGSLLMLGAHPDDENTGVIAYFARGRHIRTAYLSATRGEGGQNLIGPEQGDLMGLIRTQELLEARRIDGGEQFFTRSIDFGFSKEPEEAYAKWGRQTLLEDMVRVIRRFRPDVLVSRFPPAPGSGGHGQHTAVGHIAAEALEAAADPSRFPEQLRQGLEPWRARRLVWNTFNFSPAQDQEESRRTDRLRLEVGDYDPLLGKSYVEVAGESRSMHRSQSMGTNQRKGEAPVFFAHVAGTPAEKDLFDGVDTSWARVAGGEAVGRLLAQAGDQLDPARPSAILPLLVEAYAALGKITDPWAAVKQPELLHAIELASGLWVDAAAQRWDATPGGDLAIELEVINRSDFPLRWKRTEIRGLAAHDEPGQPDALPYNKLIEKSLTVKIPSDAGYSQPYWLREPPEGSHYRVSDSKLIGSPETPPLLEATFYLEAPGGVELPFPTPVVHRWVDRAYGERLRSLQVVPPVAVSFPRPSLIFAGAGSKQVSVRLHGNSDALEGTVTLETPKGWRVNPASAPFKMARRGQDLTVNFELTPPSQDAGGSVAAKVHAAGGVIDHGMQQIEYEHIPIQDRRQGDAAIRGRPCLGRLVALRRHRDRRARHEYAPRPAGGARTPARLHREGRHVGDAIQHDAVWLRPRPPRRAARGSQPQPLPDDAFARPGHRRRRRGLVPDPRSSAAAGAQPHHREGLRRVGPRAGPLLHGGVGQPLRRRALLPRPWRTSSTWRHALYALWQGSVHLLRVRLVPAIAGRSARRIPHLCEPGERREGEVTARGRLRPTRSLQAHARQGSDRRSRLSSRAQRPSPLPTHSSSISILALEAPVVEANQARPRSVPGDRRERLSPPGACAPYCPNGPYCPSGIATAWLSAPLMMSFTIKVPPLAPAGTRKFV